LDYIISRTGIFPPHGYETRYLSNLDLWETDRSQARRFTRYPTLTLKKLKGQGVEDVEVLEIFAEEELDEESTAFAPVITTPVIVRPEPVFEQQPLPSPVKPILKRRIAPVVRTEEVAPAPSPWRGYVHYARLNDGQERLEKMKCRDAVSFTYYYPSGQVQGQVFMCWYPLQNNTVVPSLEAYGESWLSLAHMSDVLETLSSRDYASFQPQDFCTLLENLGFRDMSNA